MESAAGCGNDRADSAATDELASATPDEPTIDEPNATVSINRKESTGEALWLSYSAGQANGRRNWRRGFAGTRLLRPAHRHSNRRAAGADSLVAATSSEAGRPDKCLSCRLPPVRATPNASSRWDPSSHMSFPRLCCAPRTKEDVPADRAEATVPAGHPMGRARKSAQRSSPHLFQRRFLNGRRSVISSGTIRNWLSAAAAKADIRDADGEPLRFSPHDFRRVSLPVGFVHDEAGRGGPRPRCRGAGRGR